MAFKEQLFAVLCVNHHKQGKDKDGPEKMWISLCGFWAQLAALFLSRHILLSKSCSTCDCGLRCRWDRNIGKDVRPVSAHTKWGELEGIWMFWVAKNFKGM